MIFYTTKGKKINAEIFSSYLSGELNDRIDYLAISMDRLLSINNKAKGTHCPSEIQLISQGFQKIQNMVIDFDNKPVDPWHSEAKHLYLIGKAVDCGRHYHLISEKEFIIFKGMYNEYCSKYNSNYNSIS